MAMRQITTALHDFNDKYYTQRLSAETIRNFGAKLKQYIADVNTACSAGENEEHIKKIINSFLEQGFYQDAAFQINTSNNIDSTIKYENKLMALIEAKKPNNKTEMVSADNINKKALWEIVLYYLLETRDTSGKRVTRKKDIEIRRLVITDGLKWVLIDAPDLENLCDGYLEKHFFKYRNNQLTYANDNMKFYDDVRVHLDSIDVTQKLPYVFFDLTTMQTSKKNWPYIYKAFSPEFFLKFGLSQQITTHMLNDRFYQELLYIIGLRETTENNKTIIQIDSSIKNSLADQVYTKYIIDKEIPTDEAVEKTFELIIIWLNRLLFIKLFEGQLISFNGDEPCYHILDNNKIKDFQNLQDLFFEVLGRKVRNDESFYRQFEQIPYLNSSLFERQPIETRDININIMKNLSVVKKSNSILGKKAAKEIAVLEYIIDFLNSYSFAAQSFEESADEQGKDIIDAAVLGLIFEKLNGYKDGSHYTPSLITEYMCKDTIEAVVIRKINATLSCDCHALWEIKERASGSIEIAQQINQAINSIHICDPAVGSGHFLVSALNRLIAIKKELGVLFKFGTNERLVECNLIIVDDVLCVFDGQGRSFVYDKQNYLSQQIQETLFNEKRLLIEDCLFGVDINPKAVSICNLRLWVELLKNAYYKNCVMETLPNIDINIKCGNSLISRMHFESGKKIGIKNIDLDKSSKALIREYKQQVKRYKAIADKGEKIQVIRTINKLKSDLHSTCAQFSLFEPIPTKQLDMYVNAFEWAFEFPETISEDGVFLGFDCVIGNPPYVQLQSMGSETDKLKEMHYSTYTRMGDIYCLFYELGYKVLNDNGLLSFITSNKWMRAGYGEPLRNFLGRYTNPTSLIDFAGHKIFDSATVDVNILTFEKGENAGLTKACTIKDECLNNLSVYVEQNSNFCDFRSNDSWVIMPQIEQQIKLKIEQIGTPLKEWNINIYRGILTGLNEAFIIDLVTRDALISADPKSAEIIRPILRGRDIKRYQFSYANLYIIATFPSKKYDIDNYPAVKDYLLSIGIERLEQTGKEHLVNGLFVKARKKTSNKWFETQDSINYWDDFSKQKIIWGEISDTPKFTFDRDGIYSLSNKAFLMTGDSLPFLLGFLNSKLCGYYFSTIATTTGVGTVQWLKYKVETLPVPQISKAEQIPYINLVNSILEYTSISGYNDYLEQQLDNAIYSLYGFTSNEIAVIEAHCHGKSKQFPLPTAYID